jgi:hypothetical protein
MQDGVEEWHAQLLHSTAMESEIILLNKVRKWTNENILKVPLVHYLEFYPVYTSLGK